MSPIRMPRYKRSASVRCFFFFFFTAACAFSFHALAREELRRLYMNVRGIGPVPLFRFVFCGISREGMTGAGRQGVGVFEQKARFLFFFFLVRFQGTRDSKDAVAEIVVARKCRQHVQTLCFHNLSGGGGEGGICESVRQQG